MKSYKYVKKKILKLQKTNSRVDAFLSGWFFKLIFCLITLLGYLAIVEYAMPNFENYIKGNESWAIALIALPIALFGIYISVLLPLLREMNTKVLGITIREIHKSVPRIADYRSEALVFIFLNTSMWIYNFILQDYRNMIAIAIYLSMCFIYLIIYAIWLYSLDPIEYFCESKIRLRIKKLDIVKTLGNASQTTIPSLCEEQIKKVNNYIATTYEKDLKTMDMLFLEALGKENTEQAKYVLIYILNKLENSKFSELNVVITNKISQRCLDISDELIKRGEFLFLFSITSSIMLVLSINLVHAMENLKNYINFIKNNVILIANNLLEFITDCQPLLLKHLFYYDMISSTNKQLADILTKLKSIENSLIFFNFYNIKSNTLENNKILLRQYDETIKALTNFPQEIVKKTNK